VAASAGIYWSIVDPKNVLPAISAALIVACPCSLLLSATFTFGNMLRYYGKNKLYLKNASVIEALSRVNHIVFDKTGTLTHTSSADILFRGSLSKEEKDAVYSLAKESAHPLSRLLKEHLLKENSATPLKVSGFKELPGKGAEEQ
jgi:Cu+-exporting ATPase